MYQFDVWFVVLTVIFLITGTRISGCVLRQNDTIDTQMKNTDIIPIIFAALDEYGSSKRLQI
jgi:hypothetical protein